MQYRSLSFLAISAALVSCGGSGSATVDVQGLWTGSESSLNLFADAPVYAAIQQDGYGFAYIGGTQSNFLAADDSFIILPPINTADIGGQSTFVYQGSGSLYGGSITGSTIGTATATKLDVGFNEIPNDENADTDCTGGCGELVLKRYTPFTGTSSLISGPWQGDSLHSPLGDQPSVAITVAADGTFSGTDSDGCAFTGSISQIPGENLFTVKVAYCSNGPSYNGLGFESSTDISGKFGNAAGTYFYLGVSQIQSDSSIPVNALFTEFKIQ